MVDNSIFAVLLLIWVCNIIPICGDHQGDTISHVQKDINFRDNSIPLSESRVDVGSVVTKLLFDNTGHATELVADTLATLEAESVSESFITSPQNSGSAPLAVSSDSVYQSDGGASVVILAEKDPEVRSTIQPTSVEADQEAIPVPAVSAPLTPSAEMRQGQDRRFNFASHAAGAVVLDKSASAKGFHNLLDDDKDKYAISPCIEEKWVVIGLSEDIVVSQVVIANYEKYSSMLKEYRIRASTVYPTEQWQDLGIFRSAPKLGEQTFDIPVSSSHTRYMRFDFLSHYDNDALCTLSQIKVHGTTVIASFQQEVERSEDSVRSVLHKLNRKDGNDSINDPADHEVRRERSLVESAAKLLSSVLAEEAAELQQLAQIEHAHAHVLHPSVVLDQVREVDIVISTGDTESNRVVAESHVPTSLVVDVSNTPPVPSVDGSPLEDVPMNGLLNGSSATQQSQFPSTRSVAEHELSESLNSPSSAVEGHNAQSANESPQLPMGSADATVTLLQGSPVQPSIQPQVPSAAPVMSGSQQREMFEELQSVYQEIDAALAPSKSPSSENVVTIAEDLEALCLPHSGDNCSVFGRIDDDSKDGKLSAGTALPVARNKNDVNTLHSLIEFADVAINRILGESIEAPSAPNATASSFNLTMAPATEEPSESEQKRQDLGSAVLAASATKLSTSGFSLLYSYADAAADAQLPFTSKAEFLKRMHAASALGASLSPTLGQAAMGEPPIAAVTTPPVIAASQVVPSSALHVVSITCLDLLRFPNFQSRMLAKLKASDPSSAEEHRGVNSQDNVFKVLMDKIKTLETSQAILELYTAQITDCYRTILTEHDRLLKISSPPAGQSSQATVTRNVPAGAIHKSEPILEPENLVSQAHEIRNTNDHPESSKVDKKAEALPQEAVNVSLTADAAPNSLHSLIKGYSEDELMVFIYTSWVAAVSSLVLSVGLGLYFCWHGKERS